MLHDVTPRTFLYEEEPEKAKNRKFHKKRDVIYIVQKTEC
ncbi:Uncharacterised protein [Bacillus cereus]|nr:Uncharacterised protein [Bacillus cereus]